MSDPATDDPNVFFFEGFEDVGYVSRFTEVTHLDNQSLVSREPYDGDRCLAFRLKGGDHYGGSLIFRFRDAGMPEPDALYGRYYLRLGEDWDSGSGGKLPGPSGTYGRAGWGGRPVNGRDGWSARMGFRPSRVAEGETQVFFYTYHADMEGKYGSNFLWDIEGRGSLRRNRWYCIETYVKLNTPGQNDGVLRGWVDGHIAVERDDLRFRDTDLLKVEQFWMNLYHGGSDPAPHDMRIYLDNVALSHGPIGPAIEGSPQ